MDLSSFIRQAVIEKIEDEYDLALFEYFEQKRPRARKNETTFTEKSYHQSWKGNHPIEKTAIY